MPLQLGTLEEGYEIVRNLNEVNTNNNLSNLT